MSNARRGQVATALLATAVAMTLAAPAAAQETGADVRLDVRGGAGIPIGDLKDYNDLGLALGVGAAYRLAPRWWARIDYETEDLPGIDWENVIKRGAEGLPLRGPETSFHHLVGNLQYRLNPPEDRWEVLAHVGAGVTLVSAEATTITGGGDFWRFSAVWGLEVVRPLTPKVSLVGRGDYYLIFMRNTDPRHLGNEFLIPFTIGVRLAL